MTNPKTLPVDSATATTMRIVLGAPEPPSGQDPYRWDEEARGDLGTPPEPRSRATTAG